MSEIKKEWNFTLPVNFLKYEAYLSEMNKKGWKLKKKTWMYLHYFEKCEAGNYKYEMEVFEKPITKEEELSLISLYRDFGYELIFQRGLQFFFRKKIEENEAPEESVRELNEKWTRMKAVYKVYSFSFIMTLFYLSQILFHFLSSTNSLLLTIEIVFFVLSSPFLIGIFHGYISYLKMDKRFREKYK